MIRLELAARSDPWSTRAKDQAVCLPVRKRTRIAMRGDQPSRELQSASRSSCSNATIGMRFARAKADVRVRRRFAGYAADDDAD